MSSGGPAATAGLRQGDVVTQIGSAKVSDSGDLVAAVATHKPGDKVDVTVRRGGSTQKFDVTLGTQPASAGNGRRVNSWGRRGTGAAPSTSVPTSARTPAARAAGRAPVR